MSIALEAAAVLDRLGARWFLGGSLASSLRGVPRATLDADIVADLSPDHVRPLMAALGEEWYADEYAIREAIKLRGCFNLIHFATAMKVDIFLPKRRRFDAGQFGRAGRIPVEDGSTIEFPVCSAEDIVAAKLEWYRLGGETSERQWHDILGVLRLAAHGLDFDLLADSAGELGVTDLLRRALDESRSRLRPGNDPRQ